MSDSHRINAYFCGTPRGTRISDWFPALLEFEPLINIVPPNEADFLFCHQGPKSYRELFSVPDTGQIRIFVAREAISPDLNIFDYAISFDSTQFGARTFRPHTALAFEKDISFGELNASQHESPERLLKRDKFCDFVYRNSLGHPIRRKIFDTLSEQVSSVDSHGDFLRNKKSTRATLAMRNRRSSWRTELLEIHQQYKFSIAAENAKFTGYTSEKILFALMGGTIPIYWGNPSVSDEFNPRRFIEFDDNDFGALVDRVLSLLESPALRLAMLSEPAMTEVQLSQLESNREQFQTWFARFLQLDRKELSTRPRGWYPDYYAGAISKMYQRERYSLARIESVLREVISPSHR